MKDEMVIDSCGLEFALLEASELTGSILIENPNRCGLKPFLRRVVNYRYSRPMVRVNNFWHEVTGFKDDLKVGGDTLYVFTTTEDEQYRPMV